MSMNLHLTIRLFGQRVPIPLWKTPTDLAEFGLTNSEYEKRYLEWVEERLDDIYGPGEGLARQATSEHVHRVKLYSSHATAKWTYG